MPPARRGRPKGNTNAKKGNKEPAVVQDGEKEDGKAKR